MNDGWGSPSNFTANPIKGRCPSPGCKKWASHELVGHPGNVVMGWYCEAHAEATASRRSKAGR